MAAALRALGRAAGAGRPALLSSLGAAGCVPAGPQAPPVPRLAPPPRHRARRGGFHVAAGTRGGARGGGAGRGGRRGRRFRRPPLAPPVPRAPPASRGGRFVRGGPEEVLEPPAEA